MSAKLTIRMGAALAAILAAGIFPGPLFAQARTEANVLMPTNERQRAVQLEYGYASAVIAGDTIYLSGVVVGKAPGEGDLRPAFERAFQHIGMILERAGSSLDDIVDMTSFHSDIEAEIGPMSEVSKRFLTGLPPAWTAIDVDRLLPDGGIAEIKIVAHRRPAAKAQ